MMDESQVIARARAGDARAFEVLMNRHATQVFNLALRVVRDPHEAEDLTQEAFVRAWRGLPRFRAEARFSTWLYRIVTNLCYDRLPRLRSELDALGALDTEAMAELPAAEETVEAALLTDELRVHLQQALAGLPEGFRLLMTLRHLQRMSYAEIAAATGLPEGTVKSGIHRARGQLREAVACYQAGDGRIEESTPALSGLGLPARSDGPAGSAAPPLARARAKPALTVGLATDVR